MSISPRFKNAKRTHSVISGIGGFYGATRYQRTNIIDIYGACDRLVSHESGQGDKGFWTACPKTWGHPRVTWFFRYRDVR